ncbi:MULTISPECIES: GerAB/ArcD/ProY family transporter [Bacillaceae]|uniref:GerAB/ArcD/ProY family transporter n=1 Tax=Bacillaceae TaxID=186817 RepID=UPI002FFFAEAB
MNRYFLYLVFTNMLMNVIIFVPKILIQYRYHGAVMAMIVSLPIGITLCYLFSYSLSKFPEQGLPEILANVKHVKVKAVIIWVIHFAWFSAGLMSLVGFIDMVSRFINPEMPKLMLIFIYLIAVFLVITLSTERVMYLLEMVLFLNIPFIGFIIFKALFNEALSWDSMLEVGTHLFEMPNLITIGAATYVFTGYMNLIIFNRVIKGKLKIWNFILIFFLGILNSITTFFIPIGFHGSDGAQEFLYPWISTADSLRLVYSPIERVIFLYLMAYMSITMISVSIHWHSGLELLKGSFKVVTSKKIGAILLAYAACSIIGVLYLNTVMLNKIVQYWMVARLGLEFVIVFCFFFWARRKVA